MEEEIITRVRSLIDLFAKGNVSQFARTIGMAQVSFNNCIIRKHKPSLDVFTKILSAFPDISAEWLLRGEGSMYKSESDRHINHIDLSTGKTTGNNSPAVIGDNNAVASGANSTVGAPDDIIRQLLAQNQQLINIISKKQ